jgi:hypothetical protein
MNDHKSAGIVFDAVLPQIRLFKSGHYEVKCQILQKRLPNAAHRREMFNEEDLVVVTFADSSSANKVFGLVQKSERIIDKARLHRSLGVFDVDCCQTRQTTGR